MSTRNTYLTLHQEGLKRVKENTLRSLETLEKELALIKEAETSWTLFRAFPDDMKSKGFWIGNLDDETISRLEDIDITTFDSASDDFPIGVYEEFPDSTKGVMNCRSTAVVDYLREIRLIDDKFYWVIK